MKKLIIIFCITTFSAFAQKPNGNEILFTFGTEYKEAEVTFVDGHKENGFVYGFISNRWIEFGNPLETGFETLENRLNLMDKSFSFKNTSDGDSRKLTQNDISEVEIKRKDGKINHYKLMDLKTVNIKGEIIDLKKKAWLPFYKKDVINVFAYDLYSENGYMTTVVYLNNPKDNFAINPIDFNRLNIFNLGKIDDKILFALNEVFKDCPEYAKKLKGNPKEILANYFNNDTAAIRKEVKEFNKKNKDLSKADKKEYEIELYEKFWTDPYLKFINEYHQACSN
jgi:hypothetical protein